MEDILDCACGTGNDLLLFHSLGYRVTGSDLSDAMLKISSKSIHERGADVVLRKADFQDLKAVHPETFDSVVCLSNSINEAEIDVTKALESMKEVLKPNGIIIFDQGQTDLSMRNPPSYAPILNSPDLSRLFTMEYDRDTMTVNIFDFVHDGKKQVFDFGHSQFKIRIRLYADWKAILKICDLKAEFYGSWDGEEYDPNRSTRLIVVAAK